MPKAFDDALLGLTVGQTAACDLKVPIADDASTASSDEGETKYRDVHVGCASRAYTATTSPPWATVDRRPLPGIKKRGGYARGAS